MHEESPPTSRGGAMKEADQLKDDFEGSTPPLLEQRLMALEKREMSPDIEDPPFPWTV